MASGAHTPTKASNKQARTPHTTTNTTHTFKQPTHTQHSHHTRPLTGLRRTTLLLGQDMMLCLILWCGIQTRGLMLEQTTDSAPDLIHIAAKRQDYDIHGQSTIQTRPLHLQCILATIFLDAVHLGVSGMRLFLRRLLRGCRAWPRLAAATQRPRVKPEPS